MADYLIIERMEEQCYIDNGEVAQNTRQGNFALSVNAARYTQNRCYLVNHCICKYKAQQER